MANRWSRKYANRPGWPQAHANRLDWLRARRARKEYTYWDGKRLGNIMRNLFQRGKFGSWPDMRGKIKGRTPWNKGKKTGPRSRSLESCRKQSETVLRQFAEGKRTSNLKGRIPYWKGKKRDESFSQLMKKVHTGKIVTEETRRKLTIANLKRLEDPEFVAGLSVRMKAAWQDPIYADKQRKQNKQRWQDPVYASKMARALGIKPNKTELHIDSYLNMWFPNEWKYTGDGQFWLAGKNPDWININGKKQIIEYNGYYTHTLEKDAARSALFAEYGFRTLHLYPSDLKDVDVLRSKIQSFMEVME